MWVWIVTGIPTVVMYIMSTWAIITITWPRFQDPESGALVLPGEVVPWVGVLLLVLAALMFVEAVRVLAGRGDATPPALPQAA
jgi:carbon starvation protein